MTDAPAPRPVRLGLPRRLRALAGPRRAYQGYVGGNRLALLHDGAQAFPAMLEAIAAARQEVLLEMYWFASDDTGSRFADALAARARAGVRVRVIFDAVGSWETDRGMFDALVRAGCEVLEYAPIAPWRKRFHVGAVNNRDHRKILVVDGAWAVTGGLNLTREWAPRAEGGEGWRDDMLAIEGPAALELRTLFLRTWGELDGASVPAPALPAAHALVVAAPGRSPVRVHAGDYRDERQAIRRAYLARIRAARRAIFLSNSYFVPDGAIGAALRRAARRGVEVRVLVPSRSDVAAVDFASRALWASLLRAGVRLFQYQGPTLHSKTAVIDGRWCTVGSFNLDHRSWRFNLEVVVEVADEGLAEAMVRRFERDLADSVEVDRRTWRFRPLYSRLLEAFFFLFRRLL